MWLLWGWGWGWFVSLWSVEYLTVSNPAWDRVPHLIENPNVLKFYEAYNNLEKHYTTLWL